MNPSRSRLIKTPGQQLLLMALGAVLAVTALMVVLSLASGGSKALPGVDTASKTITIALAEEPPQLDSSMAADQVSAFVLGHVMEGLLRYGAEGEMVPGVAERWEITDKDAIFYLRKNAIWSDGKPVTAHDFVFAWRKVVDPASASEYANIMTAIRNADEINAGKLPPTSLGVQAEGDLVLKVQFSKPVPYFDTLLAFNIFFPQREDFFNATKGRYASSADTLLYNGPFKMTKWVHGAHISFEKNQSYWNQQQIKINAIDIPYFTTDPTARFNLYRDQKIAYTGLGQENLEEAQLLGWNIKSFADGSIFYIEFNHRPGRLTGSLNFRKALQYALNPDIEVNNVIKIPGYMPGRSLFPAWLDGTKDKFRTEYPAPNIVPDTAKARAYLAKAKTELGLKAFPPIVLLTGDSPIGGKIAEYYQATLKRELGLDIRIDSQTFKQRLAKMLAGDFDMVNAGWGPDYPDPLTFGDLFITGNANNRGNYSNPALDAQIQIARTATDRKTRMQAFGAIQQIISDQVVILPEYERSNLYAVDSKMTGLVRRVIGADPDFTHVKIVKD